MNRSNDLSRKEALGKLVVLPALAAVVLSTGGIAEAKGTKAQFKYQDKPKGKDQCSTCSLFKAGKTKTAAGTCLVVAGAISPKGWCTAYAKKS